MNGVWDESRPMSLQAMEKFLISETLQRRKGNRKAAARDRGIDLSTLYRKVKDIQIEASAIDGRGRRR